MKSLWTTTALALMLGAPLAPAYAQTCADGSAPTAEGACADGSTPVEAAPADASPEAPAEKAPAENVPEAAVEAEAAPEATVEAPAKAEAEAEAEPKAAVEAEAEVEAEPQAEQPVAEETNAERGESKVERQAERKAERRAKRREKGENAKANDAEEKPADEAASEKTADTAPVEQKAEQPVTETPAANEADTAEKPAAAEDKAAEQAEKPEATEESPAAASGEAAGDEAASETVTADTPAPDAGMTAEEKAAADAVAAKPTVTPEEAEAQSVVADEITKEERARLIALERERRSEARKERRRLIGAAAAGVAVGAVAARLGGKVVQDRGDRLIVERDDGSFVVRRDENELLRGNGATVSTEQLEDDRQRTTVTRPNGVEVVTLRDGYGNILRRTKRLPNGDEIVLIDNQSIEDDRIVFDDRLPPLEVSVARDEYIVSAERAGERKLRETLDAAPVEAVERAYTLREVRGSQRLRDKVRRVDLDAITFDTGSATVTRSQVALLDGVAQAANAVIDANPRALFLVEGHTDAVGDNLSNLALSDRRAETIARILIDVYKVPAENLIVEGYGEQHLKVQTDGAERANRRVTLRNISSLLRG